MSPLIPPLEPAQTPAPLSPTVPLNPPMVGLASPFDHVDGQNRDLILEAIRQWSRGPLRDWTGSWQTTLIAWLDEVLDWLNLWGEAADTQIIQVIEQIKNDAESARDQAQQYASEIVAYQDLSMTEIMDDPASLFYRLLTNKIGAVVVSPTSSRDDVAIAEAIGRAVADGIPKVIIPELPDGGVWTLNALVSVPSGIEIDAPGKIRVSMITEPGFYIAPGVTDVTIHAADMRLGRPRPTEAEYGTGTVRGASVKASHSGVMSYGERVRVTGSFRGFRNAVRYGTWDPATATGPASNLLTGNTAEIEANDCDFGLVWYGQKGMLATVTGTFSPTAGSPDDPHLLYAPTSTAVSEDCQVNMVCHGGTGGAAASIRTQRGFQSEYLKARNVPGVLNLKDAYGTATFGLVEGLEVTGVGIDGEKLIEGGVRTEAPNEQGAATPPSAVKTVETVRVTYKTGTALRHHRALSLDDDVTIGTTEIRYHHNSVSVTDALAHMYGNRSRLGVYTVTNTGTGGIIGLRYVGTTGGHVIENPPILSGVSDGIRIEDTVTSARIPIVRSMIDTRGGVFLNARIRPALDLTRPATGTPKLSGSWHLHPAASTAPGTVTLTADRMYVMPIVIDDLTKIVRAAVKVIGVSSGTLRFGVYSDSRSGFPGALAFESAATAVAPGVVEFPVTPNLELVGGLYWIAIVAQGANVQVQGIQGPALSVPSLSAANAFDANIQHMSGVNGTLPVSYAQSGNTPNGFPQIAYLVGS